MTVLAVRDGIMAADSLITTSATRYADTNKLFRMPDGSIVGVTGEISSCCTFIEAMKDSIRNGGGAPLEELRETQDSDAMLWLRNEGVWMLEGGKSAGAVKLKGKFFADGSGLEVALTAMHYGASAVEACKMACKLNTGCGLPVKSMRLSCS